MKFFWHLTFAAILATPCLAIEKEADFKLDPARTTRNLASSDAVGRRAAIHQFIDSLDTKFVKEYDDSLLPVIHQSLKDPDFEVRLYGFSAARMLAHAVILSKGRNGGRIFGRTVSIDFRNDPELEAIVKAAVSDPDPRIRTCAVSILGKAYPPTSENEKLLTKLADGEKHPKVRREIVDGLGAGRYSSAQATRALAAMLDDQTEDVKGWAGFFLGQVKAKEALPKLVSKLDDDRPFVRERILQGIRAYGSDARTVLPDLRKRRDKEKDSSGRKRFESVIQGIEDDDKREK